jgi:hypothetical protein
MKTKIGTGEKTMQYDTMEARHEQLLSDTARARLRELEARVALVRLQAQTGSSGSSFIAERARSLQGSIAKELNASSGNRSRARS